jgi:serine/threonine protein kinase
MSFAPVSTERPEAPLFADGLGERVVAADGATGELLQILRVRASLTAVPSFEFALRERSARLANFRHGYYARVRRIDRLQAGGLAIVSDHVEGTRLSDILRVTQEQKIPIDINAALCLIRQLVPAVALLHENAREVAHGLIAPERLVVTPHARLVIVEHVLAGAIEQLQFTRERLWQEFRIALPPSAGLARFDHRADVIGIGLVALALILGRPLRAEEFPNQIAALLNGARERIAPGDEQPVSDGLRVWLARALQLDARRSFASASEALASFEEVGADDSMYVAAPVALETLLSRYVGALLEPPPVVSVPAPSVIPAEPVARIPPTTPPVQAGPETPPAVALSQFVAETLNIPVPLTQVPVERIAVAPDITELIAADDLFTRRDSKLFDPDDPFTVASGPPSETHHARTGSGTWMRTAAILALLVAIGGGAVVAARMYGGAGKAAPAAATGLLVVQSSPAGVEVFVDGVARGITPARLSLPAGAHILELRGRGVPRVIPLTVSAGAQVSQYLEFADTPLTGQLIVQSQPAGARVVIDGTDRGVAPLTVADLTPGDHEVLLNTGTATVRHVVTVQAGATASLVAPLVAAGPVSGWISVKAPFTLEVREQGRLLGTTDTDRIMMASGRHDIELVSEALGYRAKRTIDVPPGKVATIGVELPRGVVSLNASPWAEVWIDGQRAGETPLGNLSVPIGPHEIVFRHPQFGEKRHAVSVTLSEPVRLSVDMK